MPPSHTTRHLAELPSPAMNATATAHRVAGMPRQMEGDATATASGAMPSSAFIGTGTSGVGKGVALGVSCSIVAIVLIVLVVALTMHMDTGKGRYHPNARTQQDRSADTIHLRRPQQARHPNAPPGAVRRQNSTDAIIPGGLPAPYLPKQGSWKSTLDSKLAVTIEVVRNWRA